MTELTEGRLIFKFDTNWDIVIDYDKNTNPVSDYVTYFQNDKVTAVDFVASKTNTSGIKQIFFIEVKDMQGFESDNQNKLENNANLLTSTIAKNVRDTIYGIVIGNRKSTTSNHTEWINLLKILTNKENQIFVVLWLEADLTSLQPNPPQLHMITQNLKRKLSKLTHLVSIPRIDNNSISGLTVVSN